MDYPEVPENIKVILDQHPDEIKKFTQHCKNMPTARLGANVIQPEWLPGYFIKYGTDRIKNSKRLRQLIDIHKLNLLGVPDKYLYKDLVIAKKIEGKNGPGQSLTLAQIQQLWKLATISKHCDLHHSNYITTSEGNLFIIDTDNDAMPMRPKEFTSAFRILIKNNPKNQNLTPEACQWLNDALLNLNNSKTKRLR